MEIITTIGYLLFLSLPLGVWSNVPDVNKDVITKEISTRYLHEHNCKEAEFLIIEESDSDKVKFMYKCTKYAI